MGLRSFLADTRGNVAILFAVTAFPVIGVIGMAVDYNRRSTVNTHVQYALDATALALAKKADSLSEEVSEDGCSEQALTVFEQNFPEAEEYGITCVKAVPGEGTLDVGVQGRSRLRSATFFTSTSWRSTPARRRSGEPAASSWFSTTPAP